MKNQVDFNFAVYDLLGNRVGNFRSDKSKFEVDCSGFPNGLFFYKLYSGGMLIKTGKIMIE